MAYNYRFYGFGLEVDPVVVTANANAYLAAPTKGEYELSMFGNLALLAYFTSPSITSLAQVIGYMPDKECAFFVPLCIKPRGSLVPTRFALWVPYLMIDNSIGMAMGREIWGFPKEIGSMSMPLAPTDPARFVATATLFETFSMETKGVEKPLLTVSKTGSLGPLETAWHDALAFGAWVVSVLKDGVIDDLAMLPEFAALALAREVPVINLKQFRDAADGRRACYQALTRVGLQVEKVHGGGLLDGEYTLDITPCASHQVAKDLGLSGNRVRAKYGFWVDMDLKMPAGEILWQAQTR
jgi:hypothetical protein